MRAEMRRERSNVNKTLGWHISSRD